MNLDVSTMAGVTTEGENSKKQYFGASYEIVGDPDLSCAALQNAKPVVPTKVAISAVEEQRLAVKRQLDAWNNQLGMKSSFVTFQWQQQQKACHEKALSTMTSFVQEDVRKHMRKIRDDAKLYNNEGMKAASERYKQSRLEESNKEILKRLFLVSVGETPITKINNPQGKVRERKQRMDRMKAIRQAKQLQMNHINRENQLIVKRISQARSSFDHKEEKKFYARHKKLRAAMRRVKDKPKKKKTKGTPAKHDDSRKRLPPTLMSPPLPPVNNGGKSPSAGLGDELKVGDSAYQTMLTVDGARVQASTYVFPDRLHFDLLDPTTGATRGFDLTKSELNNLIDSRFRELRGFSGRERLKGITERLPQLMQGY